jgi:hypothetical protein
MKLPIFKVDNACASTERCLKFDLVKTVLH